MLKPRYSLAGFPHTRTESHVVDGSYVAVDLLQGSIAAGIPDGGGPIFTSRHQQSPCWIQTDSVHLNANIKKRIYGGEKEQTYKFKGCIH